MINLRVCGWMLLFSTLSSGTCQHVDVNASVGGEVRLPCSCSKDELEEINVFWRDRNSWVVLDIRNGRNDLTSQNQKYKGRVSGSEQEYKEGDFSITMKNLKKEDTDIYECYIHDVDTRYISLTVSDKPEGQGGTAPRSEGAAGGNLLHLIFLSALCLLLCF